MSLKILAIANQKGGTAKTSTTVNLAAALAIAGKTSLLVDMDPQGSLTEYFTNPVTLTETIYHALLEGRAVKPLVIGELIHLLPADIDLAAAEIQLPAKRNQERTLTRFLRQFAAQYDYCLLDCPPSLGVLTANALTAAHLVLVPVSTELMAERTVKLILNTIEDIKETELNPSLKVWHIIATLYDKRLAHHREMLQALRSKYGELLYPEPVTATTKYKDAVTSGTDVSDLNPKLGDFWDKLALTLIHDTQEAQ
jgi:chromosome partitioning protein